MLGAEGERLVFKELLFRNLFIGLAGLVVFWMAMFALAIYSDTSRRSRPIQADRTYSQQSLSCYDTMDFCKWPDVTKRDMPHGG